MLNIGFFAATLWLVMIKIIPSTLKHLVFHQQLFLCLFLELVKLLMWPELTNQYNSWHRWEVLNICGSIVPICIHKCNFPWNRWVLFFVLFQVYFCVQELCHHLYGFYLSKCANISVSKVLEYKLKLLSA